MVFKLYYINNEIDIFSQVSSINFFKAKQLLTLRKVNNVYVYMYVYIVTICLSILDNNK